MPPSPIKTIKDLLYWQYAKIIADSAGVGKENFGFVMSRFKKLKSGEIKWDTIREYVKERETADECCYCGKVAQLTIEHIFPQSLGKGDDERNIVWVCKECNSRKNNRRLYEYFTALYGLKRAKYCVPRLAEGKYLKFAFKVLEGEGALDLGIEDLKKNICPTCDMHPVCTDQNSKGKISPLCLDGLLTEHFRKSPGSVNGG